jgi:hypothetical protein
MTIKKADYKSYLYFILLFIYSNLLVYYFNHLVEVKYIGALSNTSISIYLLVNLIFFAFFEEFISRYFLIYTGNIGAIWITWHTYFSIVPFFLKRYSLNESLLNSIFVILSIPLLFFVKKFPKTQIYNQLFLFSRNKVLLTSISFSLFHLNNYIVLKNQLVITMIYLILLHTPFALFLSYVRIKYKFGFLYSTGFHVSYNVFTFLTFFI